MTKCCKTCEFCTVNVKYSDLCYCLMARRNNGTFEGAHKDIAKTVGKDCSLYKPKSTARMTAEVLSGYWDVPAIKPNLNGNFIRNPGFQVWQRGTFKGKKIKLTHLAADRWGVKP